MLSKVRALIVGNITDPVDSGRESAGQHSAQEAPRPSVDLPAYDPAAVVEAYRKLYYPDDAGNLAPIVDMLWELVDGSHGSASREERFCIEAMRYTNASMALGAPKALVCASDYLAGALSSCGGYALVMAELCRTAGLPARYLGLFGIPTTGSHALCEVHYDGQWHLFDPTFAVFFYSESKWSGRGQVLSTEQVMIARERPTMMQVVRHPWQLNYEEEKAFPVQPLLDPPTSHVMTYWGENGRRFMYPVAFGNDATVSVPVEVDLRQSSGFQLGERTGEWLDTWMKCIDDPRNGYFFIGGTCPTIVHCIRMKCPAPGRVVADYIFTPESSGNIMVFPLAYCLLLSQTRTDLAWRLEFFVNGPEPSFLLMAEQTVWIDTLRYAYVPESVDA